MTARFLFETDYVQRVPEYQRESACEGKKWFIPHHIVYHSHKPEKICVVFDCSAKYKGKSLNDLLMIGPDLTNSLLTKWISSSPEVLESIPVEERAQEIKKLDLQKDELPIERLLGVQWQIQSDTFGFNVNLKPKPPTRGGILSVVGSVFDPFGFVAPVVLTAKNIWQDLGRSKLGWEDEVPTEHSVHWQRWLLDLPKLSQFTIDRCFKPASFKDITSSQFRKLVSDQSCIYVWLIAVAEFMAPSSKGSHSLCL